MRPILEAMSLVLRSRRFAADQGGAVAIMFAFALLPLMLAVGAGVDYSRVSQAQADLQSAADAAALAAGRVVLESRDRDASQPARQAFDAGFQRTDGTAVTSFVVNQTGEKLVMEVGARVPLAFAGILGLTAIDLNVTAEAVFGNTSLEVALVLDNTGSNGLGRQDGRPQAGSQGAHRQARDRVGRRGQHRYRASCRSPPK
jgi:Flp pilus assembly protein TadG